MQNVQSYGRADQWCARWPARAYLDNGQRLLDAHHVVRDTGSPSANARDAKRNGDLRIAVLALRHTSENAAEGDRRLKDVHGTASG